MIAGARWEGPLNGASMQQMPGDYPPAYVPVSGWAVTALVLAIVLALPALSAVYWPEALPIVIVLLAWGSIASRRRRGMGLAIAAGVIALLAGLFGFAEARVISVAMQSLFQPLLHGAEAGDAEVAARWLAPTEDAGRHAAAWKARMESARARVGKWSGEVEVGGFWAGPWGMIMQPTGVEEVAPAGDGSVGIGDAVWVRAPSEKGVLWVAVQGDSKQPGGGVAEMVKGLDKQAKEDDKGRPTPRSIHDLRFFVPTGAGK